MKSGYCYVLTKSAGWKVARDDSWDIEVYTPTGQEKRVGARAIDGAMVQVFKCPDGGYRAQTNVFLGMGLVTK